MLKIRPVGDRLVVGRCEEESVTSGGLIIPDTAKKKMNECIVLSIGEGERDKEAGKYVGSKYKLGQRVLISQYTGLDVISPKSSLFNGEVVTVIREEDVLFTVEEPEDVMEKNWDDFIAVLASG